MLPKGRSNTTSSRSSTSDANVLETPVQFIKGVGPRLGAIFNSRGIATVRDILTFFPRAYEDRTRILTVAELVPGEPATISLSVVSSRKIPIRRLNRSMLEVRCRDEQGRTMLLKWFHAPKGMESKFVAGAKLVATGTVKIFMNQPEILHPEITWGDSASEELNVGRVVPVYTEIEGVSTRVLRKILWEAIEKFASSLTEDLPAKYLTGHRLPSLAQAIRSIHFPEEIAGEDLSKLVEFDTPAHWRLIYEEFFKFEYLVLRRRLRMAKELARSFGENGGRKAMEDLESTLPFKLTQGQKKSLEEIAKDLAQNHPMNRLIQGDVGSGKTAVAFLSIGCVLAEGGQATLMAPTEILAEQHYRNALKLFSGKLNVALLTGKTPQSERAPLLKRLAQGEPLLLIGTHALLEDPVVFSNLSLIAIDEQHRFGVDQRRTLRKKGLRSQGGQPIHPHSLVLTATPIPRTLALTAYGDLAVSTIRELPPGRSETLTKIVRDSSQKTVAYQRIREQLKTGHQAYFIFPLVNESEAEGFTHLKSAVAEAERLEKEVFPEFKVGLLHGQMSPDDKANVMDRFKQGELQILVSTTVIEVGIDVANATVIAIEHAERFGLSQLHQLRGRVGRGSAQSFCFLFAAQRVGELTANRLEVLGETTDGFKIAEADLEIRGPGEFLGTRQAGGLPFRLAHLVRDREWLLRARDDVIELLVQDPNLISPENVPLRRYFEREGGVHFDRLKTS